MADGGEYLLTGMIVGLLMKEQCRIQAGEVGLDIRDVQPVYDEDGNYLTAVDVTMASGKYRIVVSDQHVISEESS